MFEHLKKASNGSIKRSTFKRTVYILLNRPEYHIDAVIDSVVSLFLRNELIIFSVSILNTLL